MNIYHGPHLNIYYDEANKRFIQNWTSSLKNIEDFKHEMLTYTSFYKKT